MLWWVTTIEILQIFNKCFLNQTKSLLPLPFTSALLTLLSLRAELPVQGEDGGDVLQGGQAVKEGNIASTESISIPAIILY